MTTARQRVFAYVRKRRVASAADIARDLGMTSANARHHLAILQEGGQLEVVGKRPAGMRGGRPVKIYGLSRGILGDGLPLLAEHLLDAWLGSAPEPEQKSRLEDLAKRLANLPASDAGVSLMVRLAAVVKNLNKLGYHARWEAHADGPRIILEHCPYAAIIHARPELCQMDAALLAEYLDRHVTQIAKLEGDETGRPYCVFVVG
ncbi:MAG: helix-turn-helix domain-containing protein [Anaerolineales bacterium]|nr:helix-turn-helix domain-containing protein [Anaerolineales bacterium]